MPPGAAWAWAGSWRARSGQTLECRSGILQRAIVEAQAVALVDEPAHCLEAAHAVHVVVEGLLGQGHERALLAMRREHRRRAGFMGRQHDPGRAGRLADAPHAGAWWLQERDGALGRV